MSRGASDYVCEFPGCPVTAATGGLFRTSPKGGPFKGCCAEHMGEPVDPVVADIVAAIAADSPAGKAVPDGDSK